MARGGTQDPGTRTVLFTDIVGSTELTQRLGDAAAFGLLRVHDAIVRRAIDRTGGREVKHTGDGIMAVFVSSGSAMECAMDAQMEFARYEREHPENPLRVRIGAAAGEPVEHNGDFFGSTVQLAARLCNEAQPREILVSQAVADLCAGEAIRFGDAGQLALKGFDRPVSVRRLDWLATA